MNGKGRGLVKAASIILLIASLALGLLGILFFVMDDIDAISHAIQNGEPLTYSHFSRVIQIVCSFIALGIFSSAIKKCSKTEIVPLHLVCFGMFFVSLPYTIDFWMSVKTIFAEYPIYSSQLIFNTYFFVFYIYFAVVRAAKKRVGCQIGFIINLLAISALFVLILYYHLPYIREGGWEYIGLVFSPILVMLIAFVLLILASPILIVSATKGACEKYENKNGNRRVQHPNSYVPPSRPVTNNNIEILPEDDLELDYTSEVQSNTGVEQEPPYIPTYKCPKCGKAFEGKQERCPHCKAKLLWKKK